MMNRDDVWAQVNDAKMQSIDFIFKFKDQRQKLIIQASSISGNLTYEGTIAANPLADFEDIKQIINNRQCKILFRTPQLFRIKVGPIRVELVAKLKLQNKQLKQSVNEFIQTQVQLHKVIQTQKTKINSLQSIISKLKIQLKEKHTGKQFKWSQQLKQKSIKLNQNIATRITPYNGYEQFILLDKGFSQVVKTRQFWRIKSKMAEYEYISRNINWHEKGHGLYLIYSSGHCWSHSHKSLNNEQRSFQFKQGDTIRIQYDPIQWKIRFIQDKWQYFQMPISPITQNDQYYPCVAFWKQNDQVQLIV